MYDLSYHEALQDLGKFKNAHVRWGGIIVDIANEPNSSLLQILSYPLDSSGSPMTDKPYQGRFVASTAEFLDPAIYTKNIRITVTGTVISGIERTIDKKNLYLPLIAISQFHLWRDYVQSNYYGYGNYGIGCGNYGYPGWGFYGYPRWGFYRPWLMSPRW